MKTSPLVLKQAPTLIDFQQYVKKMEEIRGFNDNTSIETCLQLVEEVGELCKSIRKAEGLKIDKQNSKFKDISHEISDILIFLISIANRYSIDIEKSFREKEEINKNRKWL